MTKIFNLLFKVALCIIVFSLFVNTVPFVKHVSAYLGDVAFSLGDTKQAVIGETSLVVEVADTENARKKGLSGRSPLDTYEGLFFVFDTTGVNGIWMKDMNFPIDIIWFNDHKEVVYIEQNVLPDSFPEVFGTSVNSKFVLEVPSGFVKVNRIKKGDLFTLL
ncbi:DUF192 domain-containing protein [Candidatus Nomurabacteria bacterium]|nr:DUF192 domain-containing protein [Candidatus Nomurabacteria bacterium]